MLKLYHTLTSYQFYQHTRSHMTYNSQTYKIIFQILHHTMQFNYYFLFHYSIFKKKSKNLCLFSGIV